MPATSHETETDLALCRSALYEALALGFRPPEQETVDRLLTPAHNAALAEIAAIVDEANDSTQNLTTSVRKLMACSDLHDRASLDGSFRFLFGHTAHSKVPPYETEYGTETLFQQPQQLSDLSGFLTAFGLSMNLGQHERVDHIGGECEFLAFLTRKEAYALEKKDAAMLEETRKAQKLFLKDHLARFTPSFANLLQRAAPESFYTALGDLCRRFVLLECARFDIAAGPEHLRLRPKVAVDECLTCGSGAEALQAMSGTSPNQE